MAKNRVTIAVSEDTYAELLKASEAISYHKNQDAPISYTAEELIKFALANLPKGLPSDV